MKHRIEHPIHTAASIYPEEYALQYQAIGSSVLSAEVSVTPIESVRDLAPLFNAADVTTQPRFTPQEIFDRVRDQNKYMVVVTAPTDVAGLLNKQVKARVAAEATHLSAESNDEVA
jgi:hypothetical protein